MDVSRRPLVITTNPALLDDLHRLATAAATEVTAVPDLGQALHAWHRSPLVIIDADLEHALRALSPPPHPRSVLITRSPDAPSPSPRAPDPPGQEGRPPTLPGRSAPEPHTAPRRASSWRSDTVLPQATRPATTRADPPEPTPTPHFPRTTPKRDRPPPLYRLPRDEALLVELLATVGDRRPAPTVSVIGGRGGAGASLFAVALALAGERAGRSTALLDADPLGCGPDIYLGCDHSPRNPRTGWGDLLDQRSRTPWRALRKGLPHAGLVDVLTWARGAEGEGEALPVGAARSVLASARRGCDLVVVDLPRSFDPATRVFLNRSDLVLVIVPADVHAVVSAARMVGSLRRETDRLRLVVRGSRGGLSTSVVATSLGVELGADLPPEPGLSRVLTAGEVPARRSRSPMARYADRVIRASLAPLEAG
ncbi:septum site-determining protein Ssd [Nocardiopsis alkaliphila]|uniref:septum site-determining protein Ssd n=1 Tax=Nocardiopsis alkaliphila TaxID=225762 RepID=UPI00034D688C|nr:septum site-determining protein Ssd [Nocardiopsis alkaliphila]